MHFYKTQWAWQGVKLTRFMSIFISKKVWKFLIKIQLTKGKKVPWIMDNFKQNASLWEVTKDSFEVLQSSVFRCFEIAWVHSLQWIFCWLLLPTNSCSWQKFLHPTLPQIVGTFVLFSSCVKTILETDIYCTFFDGLKIH